ncbi:unnamed protein product [Symbiodinium microadriaticum]|nr:unnamed protein product [Symbiodinium microadriaticum]
MFAVLFLDLLREVSTITRGTQSIQASAFHAKAPSTCCVIWVLPSDGSCSHLEALSAVLGMGEGARLSISARSFPRVLPPLPEEPKSWAEAEAQRERGLRRDGRAGVEGEDAENQPPRMNVGESAIEKALEDVQTALKATESLRLGGLRTHRGLRGAVSHRPLLTDRSGSETCRHGDGAEPQDARSWLRQPKFVSRDRDPGRRRASTGSVPQVLGTTHGASEALARARRLQKERVRAEERSRRFSLSISDRLRSVCR